METSLNKRSWVYRHKKLVASSGIMFISLLLISNSPFAINQLIQVVAPEYSITVTLSPVEEECSINLEFYNSEQEALVGEGTTSFGFGYRVDPSDQEQTKAFRHNIPRGQLNMWVKIYFDELSETHYILSSIGIGEPVTSTLLGIVISVSIIPV